LTLPASEDASAEKAEVEPKGVQEREKNAFGGVKPGVGETKKVAEAYGTEHCTAFPKNMCASSEGCISRLSQSTSMLEQGPSQASREALLPRSPRTPLGVFSSNFGRSLSSALRQPSVETKRGSASKFRIPHYYDHYWDNIDKFGQFQSRTASLEIDFEKPKISTSSASASTRPKCRTNEC
jgi:hypothetical protein